jgi:hypothetical protein
MDTIWTPKGIERKSHFCKSLKIKAAPIAQMDRAADYESVLRGFGKFLKVIENLPKSSFYKGFLIVSVLGSIRSFYPILDILWTLFGHQIFGQRASDFQYTALWKAFFMCFRAFIFGLVFS